MAQADELPPTDNVKESVKPFVLTVGNGTESQPYQVSTVSELGAALAAPITSGQTRYIQLTADIIYNNNDRNQPISQNTVLDGAGHYILYSDTSYDQSLFQTAADNLTITFKNLKYGNATYPNGSYYGMLYTVNTNIDFIVENIDWDIRKGSEPFWANNHSANTLTFKGINHFKSDGNVNGGEFVEGFPIINFADDSQTTVYNDSTNADALFYCSKQEMNIGKRATLEITTSKQFLTYDGGDAQINVQEKGKFMCNFIHGTNYTVPTAGFLGGGGMSITFNFDKDSIGHFTTEKDSFSGMSPTFSAQSPKYILLESLSKRQSVLNGLRVTFVNAYPIHYLSQTGQGKLQSNSTGSVSMTARDINNGYSILYAPLPQVTALATAKVGSNLSEIETRMTQWQPETLANSGKVHYKLSRSKLYSGNDINLLVAQVSIERAKHGLVDAQNISITSDMATDAVFNFQNLLAQTYYLYYRVEEDKLSGYTLTSPWREQIVTVPAYIEVTLPDALAFRASQAGEFGKPHNLQNYAAVNHGNVPVKIELKSLTVNSNSSRLVSLVDNEVDKKQVTLKLVAENAAGIGSVTLLEGTSISSKPLKLEPFWDKQYQASLYLTGKHSISASDMAPYQVSYHLSVAIDPIL